jgi:murein DD-endopeptidase MepM/ murein hydrolase activator NlpD
MARQKYKLNTESLDFEVIKIPLSHKTQRLMVLFFISIVLFFVYAHIYSRFFENPKIMFLKSKNTNIHLKYDLLLKDIENADQIITSINNRDQNIYRTIFGLDEISYTSEKRNTNLPQGDNLHDLSQTFTVLDDLRQKVYIQSKSFDLIAKYAANIEKMAGSMPAIAPLDMLTKMRSFGKYGWRADPFTGEPRFHAGVDFGVDTGTPIYATGDGKIVKAVFASGYGWMVDIDHGFGYLTRYAHLSEILVDEGETVKRGEKIALSGATGSRCKGPHLHYEVHFKGETQNPAKFFSQSDVNYTELINKVKDEYMEIR